MDENAWAFMAFRPFAPIYKWPGILHHYTTTKTQDTTNHHVVTVFVAVVIHNVNLIINIYQ